jgi:CHAT domain-containing protein
MWSVDDEATALIMSAFYEHWLVRGESNVDSLVAAQRDALAAGYADPSRWAPFALVGDWY